jgi:hypothetical protein
MRLSRWKMFASFFLAAILSAPAWASDTHADSALPGTINYVEGQAAVGNQALSAKSIGSVELTVGQSLTTQNGKAEVLLTPGVFLRIGDNSSVKMISPSLTYTEVGVEKGHAMVEVAELHRENDLRVVENHASTQLLKTGLYSFDANQQEVRVFDGKARVQRGDEAVTVKGGHEVALNPDTSLKSRKFDKNMYKEGDLYRWSSLRSSYLAEANANEARVYVANGWYGPGWFGAGWYWNPWFGTYTFIPADGILYSPFGWGFYSPLWAYRAPIRFHVNRRFDWDDQAPHHFDRDYRVPRDMHARHFTPHEPNGFRGMREERPSAPVMRAPHAFGRFGGGFHGEFHGGFGRGRR